MATNLDDILPAMTEEETAVLDGPTSDEDAGGETAVAPDAQEVSPQSQPEREEGTVPHGAMHREREMRRELEGKLAKQEAVLQEIIARQQQIAQENQAPAPDPDEDPIGHFQHEIDQLKQTQQQRQMYEQQQLQAQRMEQERQHFVDTYAADLRQYQRDKPDFNEAYQHVATVLDKQLQAAGWTEPTQRETMLRDYETRMAAQAWQSGRSAAEVIYEFAQAQGYGASSENKMETIQRGQQASTSLSTGGRTDASNEVTLETLSDLEGAEFDKAFAKLFG